VIVAFAPLTVKPAPSAAACVAAFLAIVTFKSTTSNVVALMIVDAPDTVKLPPTKMSPLVVIVVKLADVGVVAPIVPL
jgi:hypothetical protein